MKKQLAIALGLAVVSVPAMASKARLESLGQGANGSQYIDDNRNVFLNAATLNQHKDFVTVEVGTSNAVIDGASDDAATPLTEGPRMEGGLFKSSGSMVYGLYFGHENDSANAGRAIKGISGEQNNFSLFFAGDAGVQWGAALTYGSYKNETADETNGNMAAKLGVISGDIEAFLNLGLSNTGEKGSAEYTGTSNIDLGLTYGMGDASVYFRYETSGAEEDGDDTVSRNAMTLGYARQYKLNDKANLWVDAHYAQQARECDATFAALCGGGDELTTTGLPVTVSLEVSAKDWLTLRGFISQEVLISSTDDGTDSNNNAEGNRKHGVGASLVFGDLTVDGSLILADGAGNAGVLNIDEPMSRVSVNYNF